jgi:hypothetical protein
MPTPPKPRKSLATMLQHEALKEEEEHLHAVFTMAEHRLPPPPATRPRNRKRASCFCSADARHLRLPHPVAYRDSVDGHDPRSRSPCAIKRFRRYPAVLCRGTLSGANDDDFNEKNH